MRLFVSGTDTDVGKTVFSAALAGALDATYWKPVQAGGLDETDTDKVRKLSGLSAEKIIPEAYRLNTPCSPHQAAEIDDVVIDCAAIRLPTANPLVVEGAGGLMVPLTRKILVIDLIRRLGLPVVLVARTSLGTINHSLLSIRALRSSNIGLLGIAFVGDSNPESERIICELGAAKRLGRLPILDPLNRASLSAAFASNFRADDFR